jgi:uncharacterized membrane protein
MKNIGTSPGSYKGLRGHTYPQGLPLIIMGAGVGLGGGGIMISPGQIRSG